MKKILTLALAALTVFAIAGCQGSDKDNTTKGSDTEQKTTEAQSFDAAAVKSEIMGKVVFVKEAEERSDPSAAIDEYGITEQGVTCKAYVSALGTAADQLVIFEAPDEATADAVLETAKTYIEGMAAIYADYAPEEAAKLNGAVIEKNGNYVIVVVAEDSSPAAAIVK